MIELQEVVGGYGAHPIINGVNLTIEKGEFFTLLGPNGSGKTTLFKLVTGQLPVQSGHIRIAGIPLSQLNKRDKAKRMAVLTQELQVAFDYTVEEIIRLGRYPHQTGFFKSMSRKDKEVMEQVMDITCVSPYRQQQFRLLSGGEKQRVLLAKALVQEPDILLLDEPTNHLDIKHTFQMLDLLKGWQQTRGLTIFAILHDLNIASLYADRIALLHQGSFLEVGAVDLLHKEEQLQKVYEVHVKAQAHPLLPKPQLHLLPEQAEHKRASFQMGEEMIQQLDDMLALHFPEPLRTLSNATVGNGHQWICQFHMSQQRKKPLLDHKGGVLWIKTIDTVHYEWEERDSILVIAALEWTEPNQLQASHVLVFMDGLCNESTWLDMYAAVVEGKMQAYDKLGIALDQHHKEKVVVAATEQEQGLASIELHAEIRRMTENVIQKGYRQIEWTQKREEHV